MTLSTSIKALNYKNAHIPFKDRARWGWVGYNPVRGTWESWLLEKPRTPADSESKWELRLANLQLPPESDFQGWAPSADAGFGAWLQHQPLGLSGLLRSGEGHEVRMHL